MNNPAPDLFDRNCPSRHIVDLVGSKWSMLIVRSLEEGPVRTGELSRKVDGISQKVLMQTLRGLVSHGLVVRQSYPAVPPRVEYSLTTLGYSLGQLLKQMEHWVIVNYEQLMYSNLSVSLESQEQTINSQN